MNTPIERLEIAKLKNASKIRKRLLEDRTFTHGIPLNPVKAAEELIDHINDIYNVPSYIIDWILDKYAEDKIGDWEDVSSGVLENLIKYDKLKRKNKLDGVDRNLFKLKTDDDLSELIEKYENIKSESEEEDQEFFDSDEVELFYQDAKVRIIIPRTEKAAIHFGKGTVWCTAAKIAHNYFDEYNEEGSLFYILPSRGKDKYAVHRERYEFVNAQNHSIDREKAKVLQNQFPALKKVLEDTLWNPTYDERQLGWEVVHMVQKFMEYGRSTSSDMIDYFDRARSYIDFNEFSETTKINILSELNSVNVDLLMDMGGKDLVAHALTESVLTRADERPINIDISDFDENLQKKIIDSVSPGDLSISTDWDVDTINGPYWYLKYPSKRILRHVEKLQWDWTH